MKKIDKKYLYIGFTAFGVIAASVLLIVALFKFEYIARIGDAFFAIIKPVLYGFIIAYILFPMASFFERLLKKPFAKREKQKKRLSKLARALSIVFSVLVVLLIITALLYMIIPQLVSSIAKIVVDFPEYYKNLTEWLNNFMNDNSDVATIIGDVLSKIYVFLENWVSTDLLPQLQKLLSNVTSSVTGFLTVFMDILLGLVISIYLLSGRELFCAQTKKVVYTIFPVRPANSLIKTVRRVNTVFGGYLSGVILDAMFVGVLCFIIMSILRIPYAILIAAIIGTTNIIPVLGPFIGAVPTALLVLLVEPRKFLWFILAIVILQQIDGNIIAPKILGGATGISGFWVIFTIVVAGGMFGIVGMVIGVPAFAVIYTLICEKINAVLKAKELPISSAEYGKVEHIDPESGEFILLQEEVKKEKTPSKVFSLRAFFSRFKKK